MRQLSLLIVVGCIFCALSCTNVNLPVDYPYSKFLTGKTLRGESVPLDTALFRYPYRIALKDDVLFVMDLHNLDHYYHAFTYPEGKHLVSFGKKGEGPGEMLSAYSLRVQSLDSIWTLDSDRMQITRWCLSQTEQTIEQVEQIHLNDSFLSVLDFLPMDSCILVPDYSGKYRYHRMDYAGNRISSHATIPVANEENSTSALAQAWRSFLAYSPPTDKLILATQLGEVVEVYNLANDSVKVLTGPNKYPQYEVAEGYAIPNGIKGFSDVQVTNTYIYAIFVGRGFDEYLEAYATGTKLETGGRSIYVFDLEGTPVCKYTLDRAVSGFWVDEEAGAILATDINNDDPIVRFRI